MLLIRSVTRANSPRRAAGAYRGPKKDPQKSWTDSAPCPLAGSATMMLAIAILLTILLVVADVKELKALPRRQRRLGS